MSIDNSCGHFYVHFSFWVSCCLKINTWISFRIRLLLRPPAKIQGLTWTAIPGFRCKPCKTKTKKRRTDIGQGPPKRNIIIWWIYEFENLISNSSSKVTKILHLVRIAWHPVKVRLPVPLFAPKKLVSAQLVSGNNGCSKAVHMQVAFASLMVKISDYFCAGND